MDRRQIKTRDAIFTAFCDLLAKKHYSQITVGEIIDRANVGRATFYAHFETKDFLLKELCEELFCHVFDATGYGDETHRHFFDSHTESPIFLHLLLHLQKNDHNLLSLLICENNGLFLKYFKDNLKELIRKQLPHFSKKKPKDLPDGFYINYIAASFIETVLWWIEGGMRESPDVIYKYFSVTLA